MAEDYYQTNIMDYLHIYSVHGVCQRSVQWTLLFTAYLVKGPVMAVCSVLFRRFVQLPLVRIFAILDYLDLLFSPFLLFNFTVYRSLTLIGGSHFERIPRRMSLIAYKRPVNYPLETGVVDIHKLRVIHTSSSDDTDEG